MLFCFGDSWPAGAELAKGEKTFGEILSDRLSCGFVNHAVRATSIPHLILQLQRALSNSNPTKNDLLIFFLTDSNRDLYWQDRNLVELHLGKTHENPISDFWYRHINTVQLEEYRVNTTLMTLHHMCRYHGLRELYLWGWHRINLWPEIDQNKFYHETAAEIFLEGRPYLGFCELKNSQNRFIWPNQGHPNQLGHQIIADRLYSWIKNLD